MVRALLWWFRQNARDLPWRRTDDPYAIWISEIMLQQTQVKTVIPYWERWMRALPTIEALARARPQTVLKLWEGLGYYTRARNLQVAARMIMDQHGGRFPRQLDDLRALPGIGRYTAGAICSIAFNQPAPILDGNLMRVLTRLFCIRENPQASRTNARLWHLAELMVQQAASLAGSPRNPVPPNPCTPLRLTPAQTCSHVNQALMEFGAIICTPRQPQCPECPVRHHCQAARRGCAAALPNLGPRPLAIRRQFVVFVVERRGKFLVRQRPAGMVNGHLWEFPNLDLDGPSAAAIGSGTLNRPFFQELARQQLGLRLTSVKRLGTVQHSITRYRLTLEALQAKANGLTNDAPAGLEWVSMSSLKQLPFASAHRKICTLLLNASDGY